MAALTVTAPLIVVKAEDGAQHYLRRGADLPDWVDKDHVKQFRDAGLVGAAKKPAPKAKPAGPSASGSGSGSAGGSGSSTKPATGSDTPAATTPGDGKPAEKSN